MVLAQHPSKTKPQVSVFVSLLPVLLLACDGPRTPADAGTDANSSDGGADAQDVRDAAPVVTSLETTVFVQGGRTLLVHVEPRGSLALEGAADPLDALSDEVRSAITRAPDWVSEQLARTLADVSAGTATALAQQIDEADRLWLDEIAWSISVTDPAILDWMIEHDAADIFAENAAAIYALEGRLLYADIIELDNNRTTLELVGDDGPYQLDPEIYYWYVVYPRSYLEMPAWDDGTYWRTFFQEDRTYTYHVIDYVSGAETVMEAVEDVGEWIQSFMSFGYSTNAIWPVFIYRGQYGSCGEYSILTNAAARTALIPSLTVSARADDHEWNEFWDGRWIMWDNSLGEIGTNPHHPYIDWPGIYDDDTAPGGGVFGELAHVFRFRPDEQTRPSELYTSYFPVDVTVSDADGEPVEGARVVAHSAESSFALCAWAYTGHDGTVRLELGDDLDYGFSVQHPQLGDLPSGGVRASVRTDQEDLSHSFTYSDSLPAMVEDFGEPPSGALSLALSFSVTATEQRGTNPLTTGWEIGHTYPIPQEGGVVDVYLLDAAELEALQAGEPVTAHVLARSATTGDLTISLPAGESWYLVFDNRRCPTCHRDIELAVELTE